MANRVLKLVSLIIVRGPRLCPDTLIQFYRLLSIVNSRRICRSCWFLTTCKLTGAVSQNEKKCIYNYVLISWNKYETHIIYYWALTHVISGPFGWRAAWSLDSIRCNFWSIIIISEKPVLGVIKIKFISKYSS